MRCYVFIQTTKLHIFSIYGNFLLFIFYFLKDMRTEEQVFSKDMRTEEQVFLKDMRTEEQVFLKDMRTEEHVLSLNQILSLNQRTCSHVLLSYPCKQSPCSHVLLSYPSQTIPMFSCSSVFPKNHVLLSNYHAHFSYSN